MKKKIGYWSLIIGCLFFCASINSAQSGINYSVQPPDQKTIYNFSANYNTVILVGGDTVYAPPKIWEQSKINRDGILPLMDEFKKEFEAERDAEILWLVKGLTSGNDNFNERVIRKILDINARKPTWEDFYKWLKNKKK